MKKKIWINNLALYIQVILFLALIVLLIMSCFIDLIPVVQITTGILLFLIAYNNVKLLKQKKWYLIIYIIFGIISLLSGIMGMI